MVGEFIIETDGQMYVCKRQFKDHHITKIEGWEEVLKTLYRIDRIFRKDGQLFLVKDIDDVTEL